VRGVVMQARTSQDARYFSSTIEDIKNRTSFFASKQLRVTPESIVLVSVRRDCVFALRRNIRRFI
jgi:hypothetical protein